MTYITTIEENEKEYIMRLCMKQNSLNDLSFDFSRNNLTNLEFDKLKKKYEDEVAEIETKVSDFWIEISKKYNLDIELINKYHLEFKDNKIFIE